MQRELNGKIALVTGASRGIGRATALRLGEMGATVGVHYHNAKDKAQEVVDAIVAMGSTAFAVQADLSQRDGHAKLLEGFEAELTRRFGSPAFDILVNNAGTGTRAVIEDITEEQLRRTFQTNIFSMFFLTQAVVKHLKKGAAIVNCTSITSYKGSDELLDYSSTKGAITAFTRSLSENLIGQGIRVNAVAPGPIWTPLNPCGGASEEKLKEFGKHTPMKRPGQPNEVAPAFLFLACDDASYMSAQVLHPNGGTVVGS